jgi:hypothetical protein
MLHGVSFQYELRNSAILKKILKYTFLNLIYKFLAGRFGEGAAEAGADPHDGPSEEGRAAAHAGQLHRRDLPSCLRDARRRLRAPPPHAGR